VFSKNLKKALAKKEVNQKRKIKRKEKVKTKGGEKEGRLKRKMRNTKIAKSVPKIKNFFTIFKLISEREKIKTKIDSQKRKEKTRTTFTHWSNVKKIGLKQK
jgi:cell division FtsZ-interacting protein ZapD